VFQRFVWLNHWQNTIGRELGVTPAVIVVSGYCRAEVLLPFCITRIKGVRVLVYMGGLQADYNMPICTDAGITILQDLNTWRAIFERVPGFDVCHFKKIPEDPHPESIYPFISGELSVMDSSHSVELPASQDELLGRLPGKHIRDSRRNWRRLNALCRLEFRSFDVDDIVHDGVFNEFITQKRHRYHRTGGKDIFDTKAGRDFYSMMPRILGANAKLHFSALCLDDTYLSFSLAALDQSRYYGLISTFSDEYSKYSPGRLLIEELMNYAIKSKIGVFDFTHGSEEYKMRWCNRHELLFEILFPITFYGFIYIHFMKMKSFLKQSPPFMRVMIYMRRFRYFLRFSC